MKALVCLLNCTILLAGAAPATAGWESHNTFEVEPRIARAGQLLWMRIDSDVGCFGGGPQAFVTRAGDQITVKFYMVDHACPAEFATPLLARLDSFEAGTYTMRIQLCPVPPLPCTEVDVQTLVVNAVEPGRHRIPSLSSLGLLVGIVMLAAAGAVTQWLRR